MVLTAGACAERKSNHMVSRSAAYRCSTLQQLKVNTLELDQVVTVRWNRELLVCTSTFDYGPI